MTPLPLTAFPDVANDSVGYSLWFTLHLNWEIMSLSKDIGEMDPAGGSGSASALRRRTTRRRSRSGTCPGATSSWRCSCCNRRKASTAHLWLPKPPRKFTSERMRSIFVAKWEKKACQTFDNASSADGGLFAIIVFFRHHTTRDACVRHLRCLHWCWYQTCICATLPKYYTLH